MKGSSENQNAAVIQPKKLKSEKPEPEKGVHLQKMVCTMQIKPDQKVNHHKIITEQKHQIDRLKLENLKIQTSQKVNDD